MATLKVLNAITIEDPITKSTSVRLQEPDRPGERWWGTQVESLTKDRDGLAMLVENTGDHAPGDLVRFDRDGVITSKLGIDDGGPAEPSGDGEGIQQPTEPAGKKETGGPGDHLGGPPPDGPNP